MMIKKIFLLSVLTVLLSISSEAQKPSYKTAIGMRYHPLGVSLKSNLSGKKTSFEFVGYFNDGFVLSAMYYWNFILNEPQNIRLYFGGAGQGGWRDKAAGGGAVVGIGGVIGLDYKFLKAPVNISLDWQPSYQFGKASDFEGSWGGVAVRFCF